MRWRQSCSASSRSSWRGSAGRTGRTGRTARTSASRPCGVATTKLAESLDTLNGNLAGLKTAVYALQKSADSHAAVHEIRSQKQGERMKRMIEIAKDGLARAEKEHKEILDAIR